jgi:hypothetical protein
MTYNVDNFSRVSAGGNTGGVTVDAVIYNAPAMFSYRSAGDNSATIAGADYFADAVYDLAVSDLIFCQGSDTFQVLSVATIDREAGTITTSSTGIASSVGTSNIVADAITNAKIADDAVSLENLDSGITPSHIVVYAGKESDGGGSATIAITQAGVLATDLVMAQLEASTNAVEVQKVTPTTDTVTVLLSGDPGASTIVTWQVLRAAS